jgi:hypothetical protein
MAEIWDDLRWWTARTFRRLGDARLPQSREAAVRRRRAAAVLVIVLALLAVFVFVPVPGLSCGFSPAKTCTTPDHAIDLVPQGALAYVHVDTDTSSSQFSTAKDVAGRLPDFASIEQGAFEQLGVAPGIDLRRDVGSWLGDEAAIAELGKTAQPLTLLSIGDRAGEQRFLAKIGAGKARDVKRGSSALHVFPSGLAYAELRGFLALGARPALQAALAVDAGKTKSLADSDAASAVRDSLPDQRLADAYVSKAGIPALLRSRGTLSAQLDTFADFAASDGIAAALVAHSDGFELQLDSKLGAVRARTQASFFEAFPPFDPSLAGEFSPDTVLYLNFARPSDTVRALLTQASSAAPSLAAAAHAFQAQLRKAGADLENRVLPALGGEAAAGVVDAPSGPYLTLAFNDVDEGRARTEMAQLQVPLIKTLSPQSTGQAPSFTSKQIGDVVVHSVNISPSLDVAYAVFDGKLVVSTNPAGVRQAIEGGDSLAGSDAFKAATSGASGDVSALVFLGLERLVQRAQPLGLGQVVGGFSADLAKLKALGLSVTSDENSLKTTLFLNIE